MYLLYTSLLLVILCLFRQMDHASNRDSHVGANHREVYMSELSLLPLLPHNNASVRKITNIQSALPTTGR